MCAKLALATILLFSSTALAQDQVSYEKDIRPIFEEHCAHCHGSDEQESGLRLDKRVSLLKGGDYGQPAIVPGKPEKSYLLEVIKHIDEDMKMPPDEDKLSAKKIDLVTRWIKEGANWPGQMEEIVEEKTDHWSFQSVTRPEVPTSTPETNPIDRFLLDRLKQDNLKYSKPADPRNLIRRASIVLTGIAPTPEQTAEFLTACESNPDDAYSELVERLLASPHFGERWAQHWLDVIRWAETNGSESNLYRKNAWIYRDYVVRSFNQDTPYDQFIKEQIAGDTMGVGEATGFLVSGPHVPVATVGKEETARRQARADRMDEIMQTVGASALGLTVGCARCHNHKFDPISIQDYYSMTAVFQGIEFGSRFPEFSEDHPRRKRGQELYKLIAQQRTKLRKTGPWEEDWKGYKMINFPATETESVRLTFFANSVRIDELEIFGPEDRKRNFAAPNEGTTASEEKDFIKPGSEIHKVNDGMFGTEAWSSKVPKPKETKKRPWIQFEFKEPQTIDRITVSTNREDHFEIDYLDKMPIFWQTYNVEVKTADGKWKVVGGTKMAKNLDNKHPSRAEALKEIQRLIPLLNDEGPKPSFVAKFIKPVKTHVLSRGSPESPRDEVFPAGPKQLEGSLGLDSKSPGKKRRVAFANWLASSKHPLTARVAANRFWHHVFGQGIVTTTSDFGAAGSKPTHPELLEWLASELVEPTVDSAKQGPKIKPWSMKHMIRMMVMSKAFRQSSEPNKNAIAVDANSALLWRFPPKRMAAEAIRDSIVQASGSLDPTIGGKSFRIHNVKKRYAQWKVVDNHSKHTWRRMLYQERMRRVDDQMFTAFDFPDCGQVRAKRPVSTTPLQALNLLNSDFIIEQSELIAKRSRANAGEDNTKAVNRCFELLLGRKASEDEIKTCVAIAKEHNLAIVARAILNSNEFAFIQ